MASFGSILGTVLLYIGLTVAFIFFNTPSWLVVGVLITQIGLSMRFGITLGYVGGMAYTGLGYASLMWTLPPLWVNALVGCIMIALIVFNATAQSTVSEGA